MHMCMMKYAGLARTNCRHWIWQLPMCRFSLSGAINSGLNELHFLLRFGEFQRTINQGQVDMGMEADEVSSQHAF